MATAFNLTPDRVAVFNSDNAQVFQFARPVSARVSERSQLLDHPIETGQLITDYSIVLPIEIEIAFIVSSVFYQSMYQAIRSNYLSKNLLTVQTSTANYPNMVIAEMPHEERADLYDALPISVRFRQIQLVDEQTTFSPADATQADTKSLGQQNAYGVTGVTAQSVADFNSTVTSYSSVPSASGVQTMNGPQTISVPSQQNIPVTGVQTMTSQNSLASSFGGGIPIGSQ